MMNPKKVQVILEWVASMIVFDLQSFLGLTNYYRWFIKGYSKVATPLFDLLKKNWKWDWSNGCQRAFKKLKRDVTSVLMLKLPDFERLFLLFCMFEIFLLILSFNILLVEDWALRFLKFIASTQFNKLGHELNEFTWVIIVFLVFFSSLNIIFFFQH